MKPNLRTFIDYTKKYPNKKTCMRLLYKDYKVVKEERDKWRKAFDFVVGSLNAGATTQEVEIKSSEKGTDGETEG